MLPFSLVNMPAALPPPCVCLRRPGLEAHEFIESGAPADIMLLDIRMPVKSGTDVMRDCADLLPTYPVVCHVLALLHRSPFLCVSEFCIVDAHTQTHTHVLAPIVLPCVIG